jgi:glutathione S-transferase
MKFYSAWYCPFAQRVWMALIHKEIAFDYVEVDPYEKSDWWVKLSRGTELVPVLVVMNRDGLGETAIVESTRILEFLDDYQAETAPIYAADPLERAEQKYWMDYIGNHVTPNFFRFLKANEAGDYRDKSRQGVIDGLTKVTQAMHTGGPFFSGARVSAVDITLIPIALRIDVVLRAYRDFELPRQGVNWPRYHDWYQAMLVQPVFRATGFDHEDYERRLVEHYHSYSLDERRSRINRVS